MATRRSTRDVNGGEGDRTPDLVNAIHALSQLSYAPGAPKSVRRHYIHAFPQGTAKPIGEYIRSQGNRAGANVRGRYFAALLSAEGARKQPRWRGPITTSEMTLRCVIAHR